MLKACWDCIASEQRQSDDRYSVQLNGGSNAPPWPPSNAQSGKMFAVPTQLRENDEVIIRGIMADGMLDIALRPDSNHTNIVSQINVVYSDNQITLSNVVNGISNTAGQYNASDYFIDTSFDVRFIIIPNAIRISIGESFLHSVLLQHSTDDIRFISVRGQVKEMNFMFNAY